MASIRALLFHVFLLASVNIILAEEVSDSASSDQGQTHAESQGQEYQKAGLFGLPDFSAMFPNFGSGMGFGNGMGIGNTFLTRNVETKEPSKESASPAQEEGDDHQNRHFFSALTSLTTCNYTLQAGSSCISCTQGLTCLPSNVGLLRTCRGLFQYCNNGYCSLFQGSACTTTTTTNSTG